SSRNESRLDPRPPRSHSHHSCPQPPHLLPLVQSPLHPSINIAPFIAIMIPHFTIWHHDSGKPHIRPTANTDGCTSEAIAVYFPGNSRCLSYTIPAHVNGPLWSINPDKLEARVRWNNPRSFPNGSARNSARR